MGAHWTNSYSGQEDTGRQIIFRYPLAAAIAERLVKTPVVVGRKDDPNRLTHKAYGRRYPAEG